MSSTYTGNRFAFEVTARRAAAIHSQPASPARPRAETVKTRRREQRLTLLITVIVVLSVADLLFTLAHLHSLGMIEANPLARALIHTGDSHQLISFKLASVGIGCGCLFLGRRSARIEAAAWVCAIGLAALTVHWFNYNAEIKAIADQLVEITPEGASPMWVTLADD